MSDLKDKTQEALDRHDGNRVLAAKDLGITERGLYLRLARNKSDSDVKNSINDETKRQIRRMYSTQSGNSLTAKAISIELKIPVNVIKTVLRSEKVTHESSMFTEDELRNRSQDDLISEAIEVIEANHLLGFESEKQKFIEKEYYRLRDLERIRKEDLDMISDVVSKVDPSDLSHLNTMRIKKAGLNTGKVLGVTVADWHIGFMQRVEELMRENRGYDLKTVRAFARDYAERIVAFAESQSYSYESVYIFDLGDVAEGYGSTDRGTPRAIDSSKRHIFDTGYNILVEFVETMRRIAPVRYYGVQGNHNEMADFHLVHALRERYLETADVEITLNFKPTESIVIGRSQFVMEHGQSIAKSPNPKSEKHALVNLTAFKEDYRQTDHHYYLVGHIHSNLDYESDGFEILRSPSPLGSDKYGESIGVQSRRQGKFYEIDLDLGVTSTHRIYFD